MTIHKRLIGATMQTEFLQDRLLLPAFISAVFVSAVLLFAVEPLFAKIVLPRLGGAASVWSIAMVFFQTVLLAGYAYAHLLTRIASARRAVAVHATVMLVASLVLPLHIAAGWGKPPAAGEAFWLLALFAASIGPPFFALAANGPLLQAWFVRVNHPASRNPYFLYAASNVGSFAAAGGHSRFLPFHQLHQLWPSPSELLRAQLLWRTFRR
jgi:hypothetical protein